MISKELQIKRFGIGEGIRLITFVNRKAPTISIYASFRCGSLKDPKELPGLSSLTAEMLKRGTKAHSFDDLSEKIDKIGAILETRVSRDFLSIYGKSSKEKFITVFETVKDMLLNPTFPAAEIRKAKKEIVTKIQEREQIPRYVGERELWHLFYPSTHPYAHSPDGYADTIEKIDRKELLKFYAQNFSPKDLVLVIGGDINEALVKDKAQEYFSSFKEENPVSLPSLEVPKLSGAQEKFIPMKDKSETNIFIGFNGVDGKSKDYLILKLLVEILGQFGLMGRLGEWIRDRLGLAYLASMRIERNLGQSPIRILMGVNPKNKEKAIEAALDEIKKAKKKGIKEKELEDVKGYEKGRLWFRIETSDGIARELHALERFGLGLDYWDRFPVLIESTTIKQLNDTIEKYLVPDAHVIASAGPTQ